MSLEKILVAHDFSEASDRALRFARDLARQVGASLELLYVMPDLYDGRGDEIAMLPPTTKGQSERYLEFLRTELERTAHAALKGDDVSFGSHVSRGDPVKRIEAISEQLHADAVCVGATGKGAVERALMGSVSQALVRTSRVPVLLVP